MCMLHEGSYCDRAHFAVFANHKVAAFVDILYILFYYYFLGHISFIWVDYLSTAVYNQTYTISRSLNELLSD